MNRVYIIVPVFNADRYLRECLESIKKQSDKNFICIMVDDGSTDTSEKICKDFAADDSFVLISQKNAGVSAARNTGLDYVYQNAAETDFVTFIDSDDTVREDFLESFWKSQAFSKVDAFETVWVCGWRKIQMGNEIHLLKTADDDRAKVFSGDIISDFESLDAFFDTVWANFYNVKTLKTNGLKFNRNFNLCEDTLFNFAFIDKIRNYVFINDCLYNYRVFSESLSHKLEPNEKKFNSLYDGYFIPRVQYFQKNVIQNNAYILNKLIANLVFGFIQTPCYKKCYKLKKYVNLQYCRTLGQKRVLFCLKYNLLWLYKLYLKCKRLDETSSL